VLQVFCATFGQCGICVLQAVCLDACRKLHAMGAFTDMLLPDKGSGEEAAKVDGSEEGEPLPGTARHREYYPEGIAEILKVMDILKFLSFRSSGKFFLSSRFLPLNLNFYEDEILT
jgi:hypothetical protein